MMKKSKKKKKKDSPFPVERKMAKNPYLPGEPDEFIENTMRLVHYMANKYRGRTYENSLFDYEDLVSVGTIGLIEAYQSYDPTKYDGEMDFIRYASVAIKHDIIDFLQTCYPGAKFSRLDKMTFRAISDAGLLDKPAKTIANKLGIPIENVYRGLEYFWFNKPISIQQEIYNEDGESMTLEDKLVSPMSDFFDEVVVKSFRSQLSPYEKIIFDLSSKGLTQQEIGRRMSACADTIGNLFKKVLKRARAEEKITG